ncbi:hypothetical protein PGA94_09275 [Pediococcus pentosaceus]|uniref:hypothetical protein n=1 Tax=Pediococcus pentosaceus TaxID=1255 RepID=UPI00233150C4|nr:hypothetical protein [Pediococcus pentosaceus]MDB1562964.1 hypothetical protein [Pediococcus pentosaceus]
MRLRNTDIKKDKYIEDGSLFKNEYETLFVYRLDRWNRKGYLINLSKGLIKHDLVNEEPHTPDFEWIEKVLDISIEEGKNYFPDSKYSIELVKDGE